MKKAQRLWPYAALVAVLALSAWLARRSQNAGPARPPAAPERPTHVRAAATGSRRKLWMTGGFLALLAIIGVWTASVREADANVSTTSANPNPVVNPSTSEITVNAVENTAPGVGGAITVTVGLGTIAWSSCTTNVACTSTTHTGDGTASVTMTAANDGDGSLAEPVVLKFTYTPPIVAARTFVSLAACQNSVCAPPGIITVDPSVAPTPGLPTFITLSVSANPSTCAGVVTVFATVRTSGGLPVPNGTLVSFTSNVSGTFANAFTFGGVASAQLNFTSAFTFTGSVVITAFSGGASSQAVLPVICAFGPATLLTAIASPSQIACGTSTTISSTARDAFGRPVADGTVLTYSTNLGNITLTSTMFGGVSTAVLSVPAGTSGTAQVIVSSGFVSTQTSVVVTCAPPPSASPQPVVALVATVAGVIRGPSAGDGGLVTPTP